MRKTFLLTLLGCFALVMHAQKFTLSGTLCNRSSIAVKNASVQVLSKDFSLVSSTWSKSDGRFSLSCGKGDFRLFINAHGFSQRVLELKNISRNTPLDTIRLDSLRLELSEVVIKGSNQVRKEDHILVFPTSTQKKYANDGYMLLSNLLLPKIQVNPLSGTVSALGANVTLCINGREVSQDEIKMLLPKDVLRVEYHDSPRGEFADKDLVVNFITVRYVAGGYVALRADQELRAGTYGFTAKANHKNSEFTLMYTPGYLNDKKVYTNRTEVFDNGLVQDAQGIPSVQRNQSHSTYLGYNYYTSKQTLNVRGGYNFYRTPFLSRFSRQYSSFDTDEILTEESTGNRSESVYGSFFYRNEFANKAILKADAFVQYTGNKYNREYREGNVYATRLHADEDYYDVKGSVDYSQEFKNKSNLSVTISHFHKITDVSYQSEYGSNEDLKTGETLLFVYYTYPIGNKWTLTGRLGASYLSYRQTDKKTRSYFSPRPYLSVQYRPLKTLYFQFQSYMGNAFPELSYLNNTEQIIDRWQVRRGNPDLKRTLLLDNQISIWAQLFGGHIQGFFQHLWNNHYVINTTLFENDKYIQTYSTDGDYHILAANLTYVRNIGNCFNFNLSGGWQYYSHTGVNPQHVSEWYGSFSGAYFKKGFYVGLQFSSVRRQLAGILWNSRSSASFMPYVAYYWKNLSIMAYARNPFWNYNHCQWMDTGIYQVRRSSFSSRLDHSYCLRLTWNISFGRKYKYIEDQINKDRGSAIIQVEK